MRKTNEAPGNQLTDAVSPYLLQHKDNPVHWRQWGDAAFAEARERNAALKIGAAGDAGK